MIISQLQLVALSKVELSKCIVPFQGLRITFRKCMYKCIVFKFIRSNSSSNFNIQYSYILCAVHACKYLWTKINVRKKISSFSKYIGACHKAKIKEETRPSKSKSNLNCTLIYSTVIRHKCILHQNHCCNSWFLNLLPKANVQSLSTIENLSFCMYIIGKYFPIFPLHSIHFCHSIFT